MIRSLACLGILLCSGALALSCGRSELDLGDVGNTPVMTGAAGSNAATGAAGAVSATGAAGTSPTGTGPGVAGTIGTGSAGTRGTTGAAGAVGPVTGTAGAIATTGVAGTGGTIMTGSAGTTGTMMPPTPVPCGGGSVCVPGAEKCCVQLRNGSPSAMCLPAGETCDSGTSFSCLNTASCGGGNLVCCISTQTLSTTCDSPTACLLSPGLILCAADADCPNLLPNCCGPANLRVCTPRACAGGGGGGPAGGGAGGGRGPGGGRGAGGGRPGGGGPAPTP